MLSKLAMWVDVSHNELEFSFISTEICRLFKKPLLIAMCLVYHASDRRITSQIPTSVSVDISCSSSSRLRPSVRQSSPGFPVCFASFTSAANTPLRLHPKGRFPRSRGPLAPSLPAATNRFANSLGGCSLDRLSPIEQYEMGRLLLVYCCTS